MESINVLSLFDGMSCARIAFEQAGINVENYLSSEVDEFAIEVADYNYPEDKEKRLGDVREVKGENLSIVKNRSRKIAIVGGSPCQGFSFIGKMKGAVTNCNVEITTLEQYLKLKEEGFEFSGQSYLVWEFIRLVKDVKPDYFFLENVEMSKKWEYVIDEALKVKGKFVCSSLVSAQNRKRMYWTNIKQEENIKDKKIFIKDILEDDVGEKYYLREKAIKRLEGRLNLEELKAKHSEGVFLCVDSNGRIDEFKTGVLPQRYHKGVENFGSSPFLFDGKRYRRFTPMECEKLQTVPHDFTKCVSDSQRYRMLGNGWTVEVPAHFFKNIKY